MLPPEPPPPRAPPAFSLASFITGACVALLAAAGSGRVLGGGGAVGGDSPLAGFRTLPVGHVGHSAATSGGGTGTGTITPAPTPTGAAPSPAAAAAVACSAAPVASRAARTVDASGDALEAAAAAVGVTRRRFLPPPAQARCPFDPADGGEGGGAVAAAPQPSHPPPLDQLAQYAPFDALPVTGLVVDGFDPAAGGRYVAGGGGLQRPLAFNVSFTLAPDPPPISPAGLHAVLLAPHYTAAAVEVTDLLAGLNRRGDALLHCAFAVRFSELLDPGSYTLLVTAFYASRNAPGKRAPTTHVVAVINATVVVEGPPRLPDAPCPDWRHRPGRWVSCQAMGARLAGCLRDGWVFVPHDCFVPHFPVARTAELPLWIVWAGSSVTRGNVLAWVDALLGATGVAARADVSVSSVWKCWAWFDIRIGALRLSYLDFRPAYWQGETEPCPTVAAAGNGTAAPAPAYKTHPEYKRRAAGLLKLLTGPGSLDGASAPPDVLMLEWWSPDTDYAKIEALRGWLHPNWAGRMLVHSAKQSISMMRTAAGDLQLARWFAARPFLRVEFFDDVDSAAMVQTAEFGGRSVHLHYRCSDGRGNGVGARDVAGQHVCGLTNEMTVQALLQYLLVTRPVDWPAARRIEQALRDTAADDDDSEPPQPRLDCLFRAPRPSPPPSAAPAPPPDVRVCLRCPVSLTPFTILSADMVRRLTCFPHVPNGTDYTNEEGL
jgi:hypothetical protein